MNKLRLVGRGGVRGYVASAIALAEASRPTPEIAHGSSGRHRGREIATKAARQQGKTEIA